MDQFDRNLPLEGLLVGGYVALVTVIYVLVVPLDLLGRLPVDPVDESAYVVVPLVGLPFVFSLVNGGLRGHPLGSAALGLGAGVLFAAFAGVSSVLGFGGNGDSPVWALAAVFGGYGLVCSVVGYLLGRGLAGVRSRFAAVAG